MFGEPTPSAFDLRFRLFGIPVRVHWTFWLIMALMLMNIARIDLVMFLIAMGVVFVSLLLHEIGHALMFRRYRIYSHIVLYGFGGYASPDESPVKYTQRIAVSLAGPAVNFLILGITWGSNRVDDWANASPYLGLLYSLLITVNLFLGIVNLIPVWPLDGGQVARELFVRVMGRSGIEMSLRVSLVVALVVITHSVLTHFKVTTVLNELFWGESLGILGIVIFAMIAIQNYQELQMRSRRSSYWND